MTNKPLNWPAMCFTDIFLKYFATVLSGCMLQSVTDFIKKNSTVSYLSIIFCQILSVSDNLNTSQHVM